MSGRRDQVLDAAVTVLGTGGLRGLTYQTVDAEAGVPAGTTSNHFRNRALLVTGVVGHLEALDARDWKRLAASAEHETPEQLVHALTRMVNDALGAGRHRTAARYALALEGIVRPEVRAPLRRARAAMIELTARSLTRLGSPTPEDHCRILFDYLDGLIFHRVALPEDDHDPAPGIRTVLGALLPTATAASERSG